MSKQNLSSGARAAVLAAAIAGLLFDGLELGLMPIASLSVSKSLLGKGYTAVLGGEWFAWFTAALMFGAALGGIILGDLGDRFGRSKAMGASILLYSVFAGLGAWVKTQEQMLILRFLVGIGVGGVWPNAVTLVAESWPGTSRPVVAGLLGAALNLGILMLSQLAQAWPITSDSWRWIFRLAAAPALLGLVVLFALPESPKWSGTPRERKDNGPIFRLLRRPLLRLTLIGIVLGSIPLIGAWAAGKWMIPWADKVGELVQPGYKARTQGWWALGAVLGSFSGAQVASLLGRRRSYLLISAGSAILTFSLFQLTAPLRSSFLPLVFVQGFVATLFFGWLPLYLPELFPVAVRATGSGIAYNSGRFATAIGVFAAGALFASLGGSYAKVGALGSVVYALGMAVICWVPDVPSPSPEVSNPQSRIEK